MRSTRRCLAAVLAMTLTFSDCGGMTVSAVVNSGTAISSLSENSTVSDEILPDRSGSPEVSSETDEKSASKMELPALHIGQIAKGEPLSVADETNFTYDIPVSFETSDCLLLFTNYSLDTTLETVNGTLIWSILRGKKGLNAGSASLFDEEDDWTDFETVSASPFFLLDEITDKDNAYYQMITLSPAGTSSTDNNAVSYEIGDVSEDYDYYIRAAYYPETENGEAESFYAAATIPFLAPETVATEQKQEDTSGVTGIPADDMADKVSVSENSADAADNGLLKETSEDTPDAKESIPGNTPEDTDLEITGKEPAAEETETLSENNSTAQDSARTEADDNDQPLLEEEAKGKFLLYKGTEIIETNILDEKERISISLNDTQQITAKIVPEMAQANISWESSDETVATVTPGENGTVTITAIAEGYAKLTASCRGITASVTVDAVLDTANLGNDKLLDLSGDIRVAGFEKESDHLVYNGQKITQNLRVYHKNTLLKEKTDYTLSYKNNVDAAAWNSLKAPSVTINLKGQYQGSVTLYYTIKPLDINYIDSYNTGNNGSGENSNIDGNSPGYEQTVNYSKKLNIPPPDLIFGKKKLTVKKDFVCDYTTPGKDLTALPTDFKDGDLYKAGEIYSYTVNGTGNFTGSFPMRLVILKDKKLNFSTASVKLDKKQYEYHGVPLTKSDVVIEEVKLGGQILSKTYFDHEVFASGIAGAYVMLSPTDAGRAAGYRGCKKITLKLIGDRQLKDAVTGVDWKETIPFSQKTVDKEGGLFQKGPSLLTFSEAGIAKPLTEGIDYNVKYSNAKKAGKVTVTFTGIGRYTGSLRLTYNITPNTSVRIFPGRNVINKNGAYEVSYQKDGAIPELILKDQDYTILKNKTDYTIKCKDNKTPGTAMTCEITGIGNYKGYAKTVTLTVTKADISKAALSVSDKPYDTRANKWQSTVTIKDVNGKKLSAGKDYDKTLIYNYDHEQSPPAGTTVTVTVNGLGCYEGSSITGTYRIFAKNVSTLKVVIDPQEYTGEEITLSPKKDIHIYANNTDAKKKQNEITESCYEIMESEYKNNIKTGTAKVTLHGIGNYGGVKTYSFKIQKKKYWINHVKGIQLDKTNLSLPMSEADVKKRTLTAAITAETQEKIANPTVIWSTSNSSIVAIEEITAESTADGSTTVTSAVLLMPKAEGSVTITAITQDSNKKAQCKVTVVDMPLLKEAGETIKEPIGKTYQLHMIFAESQDPNKVSWESSNSEAISVDQTGLLTMKKAGASIIKAVYTSGNHSFTQECYAVAIDPNEKKPEGKVLTYEQTPGCTDDTPYINKLLRDWEWQQKGNKTPYDYMYLPAGVYHIDAVGDEKKDVLGNDRFGGIVLTENQTLIMSPSALLVALPNSEKNSRVIWVFGRDNVTISGGQIIGERKIHTGSSGEWGHGIEISGCTNVHISDVDVSQCWGDGIYLGLYNGWDEKGNKKQYSSDGITIKNCNLHHNRRNNLSITDASNVTVDHCQFNYANGTDPQYGIDIEPNIKGYTSEHIIISNSTFQGNAKGTIQILGQKGAHVKDVTIENCNGDKAPVKAAGYGGGGTVSDVKEKDNNWNWHP